MNWLKTYNKNSTSYVLGKDGNLLPLGSEIGKPQAAPSVCAFHSPRAINSNLFLKHMKYYYNIASPGKYGFWKAQSLALYFLHKNNVHHVIIHATLLK